MGTHVDLLPLEGKVQGGPGPLLCWSNLTKAQAEEVIDWLEANGHADYDLDYQEGSGFIVRTEQPAGAERRASQRIAVSPETVAVWLTARDGKPVAGRLRDISYDGIGVVVPKQHQPGEVINVDLRNRTSRVTRTVELRAARSTRQADGSYLLGGAFATRLPAADLRALVS